MRQYREYRQLHKKHEITEKEWEDCKAYFNYNCAYCGLHIEDHFITYRKKIILGDFHKEHVDDGGANNLSNCIPSCKSCNTSKRKKDVKNWYNGNNPIFDKNKLNKIHRWLNEDYKKYIIIKPTKPKLPYKILRKRNENDMKQHYELWSLAENQELLECLIIRDKKKDVENEISKFYNT